MENDKNNIKILIVDDEKVVRDFLIQLLTTAGAIIQAVESGPKAIEALKKEDFDLAFLDVRMPEMDGLETFRELKKINPHTRYIMMTGYAVDDILKQAEKEGVACSLKKPFDINLLKKVIDDCLKAKCLQASMRILVVDDEEVVLSFFQRLLKDESYDLVTAKSGKEALEHIGKDDFDLIFLDTVLGDMKGMELYLRIQEIKPDIAIVLITGYIEKCDKIEQLEPNIQGCLYKPFEVNKIYEEIEKVKRLKGL